MDTQHKRRGHRPFVSLGTALGPLGVGVRLVGEDDFLPVLGEALGGEERVRGEGLAVAEVGREVGGREEGKGGGRETGGVANVLLSISVYSSPSESSGDREEGRKMGRRDGEEEREGKHQRLTESKGMPHCT